MTRQIVKNNLISIATHAILCALTCIFLRITWSSSHSMNQIISFWVIVVLAIANLLFYFLCGRFLLHNTENRKRNALSLVALPVVIVICIFIPTGLLDWLYAPLAVLASLIAHSLGFVGILVFALLPSIAFYLGIITRKDF